MISSEFVAPYDRSVPEHELFHGPLKDDPAMITSRYWANAYGEVLHDYLTTGQPVDISNHRGAYLGFLFENLPYLHEKVREIEDPKSYNWTASELSFHMMNGPFFRMWGPLIDNGKWFSERGNTRLDAIHVTQDFVALAGIQAYILREKSGTGKRHDYSYFSTENRDAKARFEGVGNELDAGLVLLEAIKPHDDLTVVPAPYQFERQSTQPQYNADFIVASSNGNAIGVQVKSSVMDETKVAHYDKERIVIIDASADLGNYRIMRTQQESTKLKRVGWATLLSAQYALKIKTHGPKTGHFESQDLRSVHALKYEARGMIDSTHSQFASATKIVRDKVLSRLYDPVGPQTIIDLAH